MNPAHSHNAAPSLHLREVNIAFRGGLRLRVKDFRVAAGAQVLITGPSGQGKTTLLHLLAGLLVPQSGSVEVGGTDLCQLSEGARCRLRREHFGLVFQTLNLLGHLTAVENVRLGLPTHSSSDEAAMTALRQVQMDGFAMKEASVLSLGQQQRVAVARVLAAQPSLILADEPTSSLDADNAEAVLQALLTAAKSATLVMVSHDLRLRAAFPKVYQIDEVLRP